ncbi:TVG0067031 [Thermoplasma volcanium GSS1]|uniref:TVG0067031 protein n=1 Tax=Thermoplasma volcanium (strain ATCC 51530 / DSM 4299 / JCM 9571 / NBRC 15438 / GSS1) TaxID=273116 RepID=Q97CN5_THEVO|nr:hypothetical protein [Thermoplasma volcanium]BAB59208.1 TVG0067031 [Thermoplasma volcanium GSS1]
MDIKTVGRIGVVIVLVSLILFGSSIFYISRDTSSYSHTITPGSSIEITKEAAVSEYLSYKILFVSSSSSISSYLSSPDGTHYTFSHTMNTSGSMMAVQSGPWSLIVTNTGNTTENVEVVFSIVPQPVFFMLYISLALLAFGIAAIVLKPVRNAAIRWNKKREEKKALRP